MDTPTHGAVRRLDSGDAPSSYVCPITHGVMDHPVMDLDGYSYERDAILHWLREHSNSPYTRRSLQPSDLKPNRALRESIREWRMRGARRAPTSGPAKGRQPQTAPSGEGGPVVPMAMPSEPRAAVSVGSRDTDASSSQSCDCGAGPATTRASRLHVSLSLTLAAMVANGDTDTVVGHLKVSPPDSPLKGDRVPVDMCFVLDTSGSMNAEARLKVESGDEEVDGLSLLDVVRHGVRTVIEVLGPGDRVAVVQYSSRASVVHELIYMNANGKHVSYSQVKKLRPSGTTNLWDGLKRGLDVLRQGRGDLRGRTQCLMLLTDGVPNVEPPRGHIPMLQKYMARFPEMSTCSINTFGFGYDLDSNLLRQIASTGLGTYSFIPDVGFVGTAFIHSVSNLLSVAAKNLMVLLEVPGAKLTSKHVCGAFESKPCKDKPGSLLVHMGSACFEQDRDIIVKLPPLLLQDSNVSLTASITYTDACTDEFVSLEPVTSHVLVSEPENAETIYHCCRLAMVDELLQIARLPSFKCRLETLEPRVADLVQMIEDAEPKDCEDETLSQRFEGMIRDLTGQVSEAVSRMDYFTRWGRHYFASLMFAHMMQQCNNFKDPGVQCYGGTIFKDIRDIADDLFCALPQPESTRTTGSGAQAAGSGTLQRQSRATLNMARYNCSSAPCFAGFCTVRMSDGSHKRIDALRKGDVVWTGGASNSETDVAEVLCLTATPCASNTTAFVKFPSGLCITPYHPVRDAQGTWCFPQQLHDVRHLSCAFVYNLVLSRGHEVSVNGVQCITLGHHRSDPVLAHPYLGTQLVVNDLAASKGWERGYVIINGLIRDPNTKLICGMDTAPRTTHRNLLFSDVISPNRKVSCLVECHTTE